MNCAGEQEQEQEQDEEEGLELAPEFDIEAQEDCCQMG